MVGVLGADPDAPVKEWDDGLVRTQHPPSPLTRRLMSHWMYRSSWEAPALTDTSRMALRAFFVTSEKRGYSEQQQEIMISRFWQSWGSAGAGDPAFAYVSNKVQESLTETHRPVTSDPILSWLMDGMSWTSGPFPDNESVSKSVLAVSDSMVLRYPELVTAILEKRDGTDRRLLKGLADLVQWNLGEDIKDRVAGADGILAQLAEAGIDLPKELRKASKSPKSIRPPAKSTKAAIARRQPTPIRKVSRK